MSSDLFRFLLATTIRTIEINASPAAQPTAIPIIAPVERLSPPEFVPESPLLLSVVAGVPSTSGLTVSFPGDISVSDVATSMVTPSLIIRIKGF
eukprot:jgi/Picsp_1/6258/NSC_03612-R1_---NA---